MRYQRWLNVTAASIDKKLALVLAKTQILQIRPIVTPLLDHYSLMEI